MNRSFKSVMARLLQSKIAPPVSPETLVPYPKHKMRARKWRPRTMVRKQFAPSWSWSATSSLDHVLRGSPLSPWTNTRLNQSGEVSLRPSCFLVCGWDFLHTQMAVFETCLSRLRTHESASYAKLCFRPLVMYRRDMNRILLLSSLAARCSQPR